MNEHTTEKWIEANLSAAGRVPRWGIVFLVLIALGAVGFWLGSGEGLRALQAFWVNFLFFAGIAQGGVILAVIVHVAKGKWGGPIVRLGLMNAAFVPVTLLLYGVIVFATFQFVPWVKHPIAAKSWWLEPTFFAVRVGFALALIAAFSLYFAYRILRPEAGAVAEKGNNPYPAWLTRNWKGYEVEKEKSAKILAVFAPVMLFVYAICYSLVGFDLIMTLDPHWFSTLFGAYFFITCIYMGMAAVIILATLLRGPMGLKETLSSTRFHDIGKLLFGFCILSTDFLWSQFLVIWYGDLPEENAYILQRVSEQPWSTLSWVILLCGFIIPFVVLLNRKVKTVPAALSVVALVVLIGGFFERAVTVLRSIYPETGAGFPIGYVEILISLGFLGIYGLVLFWALRRAPVVPSDSYAVTGH